MATFLHGITGTLTWTQGSGEANETVRTAAFHAVRLRMQRRMVDATPYSWNVLAYVPDIYGWYAEFDCWMEQNVQPGFFNTVQATVTFYTKAANVPCYIGGVTIEDIRVSLSVDGATGVTFLVRGNTALTRTIPA